MDKVSEPVLSGDSNDVEIKIEFPEIDIEEEEAASHLHSDNGTAKQIENEVVSFDPVFNLWTSKATSCLISQYKKYRSMVGQSYRLRSLRDMFETISVEMQKHGYYFSPQKCENKWRVLERKYKNLVLREMLKKPGRMKHYGHWEHKRALDEIFHEKRKNVYLDESEYPPVGNSTKYALILPNVTSEQNSNQSSNTVVQKDKQSNDLSKNLQNFDTNDSLSTVCSNPQITKDVEDSASKVVSVYFEKILEEMKRYFDSIEHKKERRHREKMAIRQSELEVQRKLLKLKEQKFDLEKKKLIAMAQNIQLNMM